MMMRGLLLLLVGLSACVLAGDEATVHAVNLGGTQEHSKMPKNFVKSKSVALSRFGEEDQGEQLGGPSRAAC